MMTLRIPIGHRRADGRAVLVSLADTGLIELAVRGAEHRAPSCGDEHRNCRNDVWHLTFDEAEALAGALRDLALIVRIRNDVGLAEVA